MAELFMECEEEELEPWQKKVKEVEEDDDEPIFVGEIPGSKPAVSNILNRVNPSSYSRGIKNGALSRGITAAFKPTNQHYTNPTSNPVAASPVTLHPESRSSDSSVIVQPLSKPDYITKSSRVVPNNSSELLFDLTQDTGLSHYQGGPTLSIAGVNESSFLSKRPSTSDVNSANPKKPKPSDGVSGTNSSAVFPSVKTLSVTSPQAVPSKGTNTSSNQSKNGTPFPRACPKCNIHFNLLDPLKNHMKKKGIHRCTKCRLQFLTCKEKMDHKTQHHRTFIKPKQLEGLPPGTKVTIRASVGPLQSGSSTTPSISASTSTLQLSPPRTKNITAKNPTKSNTSKPNIIKSNASKPNSSKPNGSKSKYKSKISNMQKKQSTLASNNRKSKVNTALRNLRYRRGVHKCIECCSEIKDFANHFPTYVHCSFCRYNTSCSKAYVNHMMSFHSNRPSKRFCIFKKHSEDLRGITLVCLNCDFLTDVSGLDNMATHLSQHETHTCQIVIEKVSVCIPTSEHLSE
ncbi:hypothetical protein MC885_016763 [Smutsia gigantea]|nr:hypothetical protein MC885_016763 [Smutsia gigantea]